MIKKEKNSPIETRIEMKPKANCRDCFGRGWLAYVHQTDTRMRVLRPCHCVKALIPLEALEDKRGSSSEHIAVV